MDVKVLWQSPREETPLPGRGVHIWLAGIENEIKNLERLAGLLSGDESERAGRFFFEKDRIRYIVSHGVLRLILSRYVRLSPSGLRFAVGKRGKPFLDNATPGNITFSMSHSGQLFVCGIAENREIGVDVEFMKDIKDMDRLAGRFFSVREKEEYYKLPGGKRKKAFFTCWTRKEAFVKAVGEGLYMPLSDFSVSTDPCVKSGVEIHSGPGAGRTWPVGDIPLEDTGYAGAFVTEGAPGEIVFLKWGP
jgi:4'-phosphopantetheinyl transferase